MMKCATSMPSAVSATTTTSRSIPISKNLRTAAATRWHSSACSTSEKSCALPRELSEPSAVQPRHLLANTCPRFPSPAAGDTGVYIGQTLDADGRGDGHLQEAKRYPDRKSSQAANAAKDKKTLALVRVPQSRFKSFADKIEKSFPALRPLLERILGYPPTLRQIVHTSCSPWRPITLASSAPTASTSCTIKCWTSILESLTRQSSVSMATTAACPPGSSTTAGSQQPALREPPRWPPSSSLALALLLLPLPLPHAHPLALRPRQRSNSKQLLLPLARP